MAQRIGENGVIVRGISTTVEVETMARILALVKGSSKAQVYREAVVKLFREEFGNKSITQVLKELGVEL